MDDRAEILGKSRRNILNLNSMKYTHKYLALSLLLLLINCTKMDYTYSKFIQDGETVYSIKPSRVKLYPGENRIKLEVSIVTSPTLNKLKIYWNSRNDSTEWQIKPDINNDSTFVIGIIDSLAEGRHTFEFKTIDNLGNFSVIMDTVGQVYGDLYEGGLKNRDPKSAVMNIENGQMEIRWSGAPDDGGPIEGEVSYINTEGETIRIRVPLDESETLIAARPIDDSIRYRMIYLPEKQAIDTFYTQLRSIKLTSPPKVLDKSKFMYLILPTDAGSYSATWPFSNIFDNDLNTWWGTLANSGTPHWFTLDLGVEAKLTEFTFWQRGVISETSLVYTHANIRKCELWGSNDPDTDGGWINWTKLLQCEVNKSDDPKGGHTFSFSPYVPTARYIRFKVFETWNASFSHRSFLGELSFTGIVEE